MVADLDSAVSEPEAEQADALEQRNEFFQEQAHVLGATDSPKILLLSRRGTPLSVYRRVRLEEERRTNDNDLPAWLGMKLESTVAELYSAATGNRTREDNRQHLHPQYPYIGCHLDRRVWGNPRTLVELKTRSYFTGWGDDGTTNIPPDVWVQVQHEMAVTGATECHVAVLFGLRVYRTYPIARHDEFIDDRLIPTLVRFWEDFVIPGVPPDPTGNAEDTAYVQRTRGGNSGVIKAATAEQQQYIERYRLARINLAQATEAEKAAANKVKLIIGADADGIEGPFGVIYWKRSKPAKKTEWKVLAQVYRNAAEELLEMANPGDDPETVLRLGHIQALLPVAEELYTKVKAEGDRRIDPRFTEEN